MNNGAEQEELFSHPTSGAKRGPELFEYRHKFQDDVHGLILVNSLERDIIDTPEFQRLFRVSQLGFVDLVFPTANHTRGAHSIGACHLVGELMDHLEQNHRTNLNDSLRRILPDGFPKCERILIRLGGLLHDITHGPYSHDIEKKKHVIKDKIKSRSNYGAYDKHDAYETNPALFSLLLDSDQSVLARLLRRYSDRFWTLMQLESENADEEFGPFANLSRFVREVKKSKWVQQPEFGEKVLPHLLFHLLAYESPDDPYPFDTSRTYLNDGNVTAATKWGLGEEGDWESLHCAWYQPYRHDIIGNTLSADLLDYLRRDCNRMGFERAPDKNILNYFVLAPIDGDGQKSAQRCRTAVDVNDYKRGMLRNDLMNDIFRLLDLRHEIHERAVTHRMVHAATAMFSRALYLLGDSKPRPRELFFPSDDGTCSMAGDDCFLHSLIKTATEKSVTKDSEDTSRKGEDARDLLIKVAERRLYRPLMVIPGHRVRLIAPDHGADGSSQEQEETIARRLAAIVDSRRYSPFFMFLSECAEQLLLHVIDEGQLLKHIKGIAADNNKLKRAFGAVPKRIIIWTTPYKQLYKDPAIAVLADSKRHVLDNLPASMEESTDLTEVALFARANCAIQHADDKYAGMWNIYVFVSDGLFYSGVIAKLVDGHPCGQEFTEKRQDHAHASCLGIARKLLTLALEVAYSDWIEERESDESVRATVGYSDGMPPLLEQPMQVTELGRLLELFVAKCTEATLKPKMMARLMSVSAVETDHHYLHGDPSQDPHGFTICRDIGYRCDREVDLVSMNPAGVFFDERARRFAKRLNGLGAPRKGLSEREFNDLLSRFKDQAERSSLEASDVDSKLKLKAARDGEPGMLNEYLKELLGSEVFRESA